MMTLKAKNHKHRDINIDFAEFTAEIRKILVFLNISYAFSNYTSLFPYKFMQFKNEKNI